MQHGAGDLARDEGAIIRVGAVGRRSRARSAGRPSRRPLGLQARHDHEDQVAVEGADRPRHRYGEVGILVGHVAHRPVRSSRGGLGSRILGERQEGADLVENRLLDVGRAFAVDRPPAEAPEVEEAWMRAGLHAVARRAPRRVSCITSGSPA